MKAKRSRVQCLALLLLALIVSSDALNVASTIEASVSTRHRVESFGQSFSRWAQHSERNLEQVLSPAAVGTAKKVFQKLRNGRTLQEMQDQLGSMIHAQLDASWTTASAWANGNHLTMTDISDQPSPRVDNQYTQTAAEEGATQATGGGGARFSARMTASKESSTSNEGHSVPGMFLLWVSMFLWGLGRNVSGSNPSASDMKPRNVIEVAKEGIISSTWISNPQKANFMGDGGNPATMLSCLSGNFLAGFAAISLALAVMFAPAAAKTKLWAMAAIQAMTGISVTQMLMDNQDTQPDYTAVKNSRQE